MRKRDLRRTLVALLIVAGWAWAQNASAEPQAIFLVRHAERAATSGRVPSDTGLSPEGAMRAQHLAAELKDAKIAAIFTSEYQRTQQTAEPLSTSLGIRPEVVPGDDVRSLVAKIRSAPGNVLVVGHSNTLPQIIHALGIRTGVTVSESDYGNLFIVIQGETPRLIQLHYR